MLAGKQLPFNHCYASRLRKPTKERIDIAASMFAFAGCLSSHLINSSILLFFLGLFGIQNSLTVKFIPHIH